AAQIITADQRTLGLKNLDGYASLDTTANVSGRARGTVADAGQINAEWDLRDLAARGLAGATGEFALRTANEADVAPLADFLLDEPGLAGRVNIQVDGKLRSGRNETVVAAKLSGLHTPGEGAEVRPVDLSLDGRISSGEDGLSGTVAVGGEPGRLDGRFSYRG